MTHPNLSTKESSISFALSSNLDTLNTMSNDNGISTDSMKEFVRNTVISINKKDVAHKSPATKLFLNSLERQYSKSAILQLVYNTILSGDNLKVFN